MATMFDPQDAARVGELRPLALLNGQHQLPPSQAMGQSGFWRPRRLQRAADPQAAWKLYWQKRKPVRSLAELCRAAESPLRWSLASDSLPAASQQMLALLDGHARGSARRDAANHEDASSSAKIVASWLEEASVADMGLEFSISCIAAAWLLSEMGGSDRPLGWSILDFLTSTAEQAQLWQPDAELPPEAVVVEQILAGELPLTLAYLFPEMAPLRAMRDPARQRLSRGLSELLNGQGLPGGANIGVLRPLAACWTRCRAIGTRLEKGTWSDEAEKQYQWVVRQAVRWTAPGGGPLLGEENAEPWSPDFLRTALRLGGKKKDAAAAAALLGKPKVGKRGKTRGKTPSPSDDSEWSGLAVMRSDWSPAASVVAIDYSTPDMRVEVWADRRRLFDGVLAAAPRAEGHALHPTGAWQNLCWFDDKDVTYLELRLDLSGGARLERQILLARDDAFLLLADHLHHGESALLEHQWQLPLAPGLLFCGEGETRDAVVVDAKPLARLVPLALPEWRIDPRVGELSDDDGRVKLAQQSQGQAMACPLFIDLKPRRASRPSTWRQLTIAESLHIQPAETAVGYRVQCGKKQWIYYRSLGPRGNRTLLGQNTSSEFLMARFLASKGTAKELIEIEG